MDILEKNEYQQFVKTDETTFIKLERLPEEKVTNAIVTKSIKETSEQIFNPEVSGVLRWK